MDTHLLRYVDADLTPEARWLLLQWSITEGLDQTLTCSLRELYRRLGIPAQHAKPALEVLKARSYVIYETVCRGRGRPVSSHQVSPVFRHSLEKPDAPVTAHHSEIESLCRQAITIRASHKQKNKNLMSGEQRSKMLSPATYWLLVVLLAHAEVPGIVRGLSYGQLQAVTGMSRERLKSQLSKLKKLGVIARHHPGILSKGGARMRSVYVLNLAHPLLWGEDSIGLTVKYRPEKGPGDVNLVTGFYQAAIVASELIENFGRVAEMAKKADALDEEKMNFKPSFKNPSLRECISKAFDDLLQNAKAILPPVKLTMPAVTGINQVHRLGMSPILEAHIRAYAMMLLSNSWKDLECGRGGACDPIGSVMTAIQNDCIALQGPADKEVVSTQNSDFLVFIYALSYHLAVNIQIELKNIEMEYGDSDFPAAVFSMHSFVYEDYEWWRLQVHFHASGGVVYLVDKIRILIPVSLKLPECLGFLKRVE